MWQTVNDNQFKVYSFMVSGLASGVRIAFRVKGIRVSDVDLNVESSNTGALIIRTRLWGML